MPRPAGARGWTTSSGRHGLVRAAASTSSRARGGMTRASARGRGLRQACGPARRCRSRSSPWSPPPGHDRRRREPGQRPSGAACAHRRPAELGWVRRPGGADVAGRGGVAGPRSEHSGWPGSAGRSGPATPAPALPPASAGSPPCCRRIPRRGCPGGQGRRTGAADQLMRGEWDVLGVDRTDLVAPDWFHDPVTGRRSAPDRYAFRINHRSRGADRQHQAGLGDLPPAAPHAAGHGLVPHPRRGVRRPGGRPAALLVAGEPLPVRRSLDERHRDRHPPDQPGLDPAAPGRLAGGPACSSTTRWRSSRSAGISSTWPRSGAGVPRPTTTSSPRRPGSWWPAAPSRGSPRRRAGGGNPRAADGELVRNTYRPASAASWPGLPVLRRELGLLAAAEAEASGRPLARPPAAAVRDGRQRRSAARRAAAAAPPG